LIQADLGFSRYTDTFVGSWDKVNVFFVTLALMIGTAGLPHVIVRFYTVPNVKAARWSAFWALLFISMLYLTAPATAAFARYYMIESLNETTEATLPEWFSNWEQTGLIQWFDDGDGKLRYSAGEDNEIFRNGSLNTAELGAIREDHQRWLATAGAKGIDARETMNDKGLSGPDRDIIVLATPEMAELATWIIALVAAGGLAAALSTASGLLLVISSSIAHDVYFRIINPQADEKQRLLVGRSVIGLAVVIAGLFGVYPPGFVSQVVAFAFGLAAASFFPVIVLGIFSKRVGTWPAIAGMVAGIGFTAFYIIASVYGGMAPWTFGIFERGISPQGIGAIGALLNFVVTLSLTPFCAPPSAESRDMVDQVREPEMIEDGPRVPGL
jgi:cation/acetate symporter